MISCKKEVNPELKVSVVDVNRTPLRNAVVEVRADGSDQARLIPEFQESKRTDNYGNAYFNFKGTVLITIIATRNRKSDSTYALLETKRMRKDDNVYEKTLVLK